MLCPLRSFIILVRMIPLRGPWANFFKFPMGKFLQAVYELLHHSGAARYISSCRQWAAESTYHGLTPPPMLANSVCGVVGLRYLVAER